MGRLQLFSSYAGDDPISPSPPSSSQALPLYFPTILPDLSIFEHLAPFAFFLLYNKEEKYSSALQGLVICSTFHLILHSDEDSPLMACLVLDLMAWLIVATVVVLLSCVVMLLLVLSNIHVVVVVVVVDGDGGDH